MADDFARAARQVLGEEGLRPDTWSNEPGFVYGEHSHDYHKVLFCTSGSIVFNTPEGEVPMGPGDRLDLPPGTPHSAVVGPDGVTCMEARRP